MASAPDVMEKLVSLAKRRGYVFQSSEIYGGAASVWDYGPLGVELRRNIMEAWWRSMVTERDDIEGLEAAILMNPRVWEASGHVAGFTDPLIECKNCKRRFRADSPEVQAHQCPVCGTKDTFGEPRMFNLMFKTFMGPVEDAAATVYLRPETAQGSYVNFQNVLQSSRQRIPFGIAQIGKAFRNEITPGNFIFRTREFEQMEMQFFVEPGTDDEWFEYWKRGAWTGTVDLGIRQEKLRFHEHGSGRAGPLRQARVRHPVRVPVRLAGVRGNSQPHGLRPEAASGVFGQEARVRRSGRPQQALPARTWSKPRSVSVARCWSRSWTRTAKKKSKARSRVVLALHPRLAPIKVAVFPLVKKDGMPELATEHSRRRSEARHPELLRRQRLDRPALPPAGRSRHALLHHDRWPDGAGPHRDDSASRHARAGSRRCDHLVNWLLEQIR